jgi:hypothetical protein
VLGLGRKDLLMPDATFCEPHRGEPLFSCRL